MRLLAPLLAAWAAAAPCGALAGEDAAPGEAPTEGEPGPPPPSPAPPEPTLAPSAPPELEPTPSEPPPPQPTPPPKPPSGREEDRWFDVSHTFVEQRIFAPILRLDRFFSDERELDAERARSFLRWRSEVRVTEDATQPTFTTGVRATLRLPGLNKRLRRLRIVLAGETRDAVSTLFPPREPDEEGPSTEAGVEEEDISRGDAGLRFYLWDSLVSHADLGGGVLVRLPPGAYARLRFRWAVPVSDLFLTRAAVTGFIRTDVGFGTTVSAELERPLTPDVAARIGGSGTLSEESPGVEWRGELAVLAAFGRRVGAQVGVAVDGATDPHALEGTAIVPPQVERYRLYTRLRRDFYRRWLFLELEPEVAWPWDLEQGRHRAWGMAIRLEVQFHGNEATARPPPPPPPEPEDPPAEPAPQPEPRGS